MPAFTHGAWAALEDMLEPEMPRLAMFAFVSLLRS
jgi:hypothetical protein